MPDETNLKPLGRSACAGASARIETFLAQDPDSTAHSLAMPTDGVFRTGEGL